MKINELYTKYNIEVGKITLKPNYCLIPVTSFRPTEDNIQIFNDIYQTIMEANLNKIVRTKSGGISYKRCNFRLPAYDVKVSLDKRTHELKEVEIILLVADGFSRIQLTNRDTKSGSGKSNFRKFIDILKKFDIDINKYAISEEDGLKAKSEIKKDLIRAYRPSIPGFNHIFTNVHHIDYNSSFPAGLVNHHPEFKDAINYIYNRRHEDATCKAILNYSIGMMQSPYINYKYAHLARDAKNDNYDRLIEMTNKLLANGNMILAYNTDGIWYSGNQYHDNDEGTELGQWKHDYTNCTWRAKSDGAYEFIDGNGKYYPVVRGTTKLDKYKDRKAGQWEWGDIFSEDARIIHFNWDDKKGVIINEEII